VLEYNRREVIIISVETQKETPKILTGLPDESMRMIMELGGARWSNTIIVDGEQMLIMANPTAFGAVLEKLSAQLASTKTAGEYGEVIARGLYDQAQIDNQ
jgi:hypothetical protein